jgi:hypothetical protein
MWLSTIDDDDDDAAEQLNNNKVVVSMEHPSSEDPALQLPIDISYSKLAGSVL